MLRFSFFLSNYDFVRFFIYFTSFFPLINWLSYALTLSFYSTKKSELYEKFVFVRSIFNFGSNNISYIL